MKHFKLLLAGAALAFGATVATFVLSDVASSVLPVATAQAKKQTYHPVRPDQSKMISKTYDFRDFNEIDVATGVVVNYSVGPYKAIEVKVMPELEKYLVVDCKKGELSAKVKLPEGQSSPTHLTTGCVIMNVTAPSVNDFEVSSGAIINSNDALNVTNLSVDASSGGVINLDKAKASAMEVECSSGAVINLTYCTTTNFDAEVSSGAVLNTVKLNATASVFEISSGATANVEGEGDRMKAEVTSGASFNAQEFPVDYAKLEVTTAASANVKAKTLDATKSTEGTYKNSYKK